MSFLMMQKNQVTLHHCEPKDSDNSVANFQSGALLPVK